MLSELFIVYILFAHFIADFITQTNNMAKGKSESNLILFLHCYVYGLVMLWSIIPIAMDKHNLMYVLWVLVNVITHFFVDYITSRINKYLWSKGDMHNFFVGVGADQFIHAATLIITAKYLLGA